DPENGSCLVCTPGKSCDTDCYQGTEKTHKNDSESQGTTQKPEECPSEFWGPNCTQPCCSLCVDEICDPENGSCLVCTPGKSCDTDCYKVTHRIHGNDSESQGTTRVCPSEFWGPNCTQPCCSLCVDEICDPENGSCLVCTPGESCAIDCYQGTNKTHKNDSESQDTTQKPEECQSKFWGPNCTQPCCSLCVDEICDPENGSCLVCTPGMSCDTECYKPPETSTEGEAVYECPKTFWGFKCTNACCSLCSDYLCHPFTGTCFACLPGKDCKKDCYKVLTNSSLKNDVSKLAVSRDTSKKGNSALAGLIVFVSVAVGIQALVIVCSTLFQVPPPETGYKEDADVEGYEMKKKRQRKKQNKKERAKERGRA
ncbi:hypothetical protein EGW08_005567, partial [Elysia chlorotica]